jgi:hypothetical protein
MLGYLFGEFGKVAQKRHYLFYKREKAVEYTVTDGHGKCLRVEKLLKSPPEAEAELVSIVKKELGDGPYQLSPVVVKEIFWGELTEW